VPFTARGTQCGGASGWGEKRGGGALCRSRGRLARSSASASVRHVIRALVQLPYLEKNLSRAGRGCGTGPERKIKTFVPPRAIAPAKSAHLIPVSSANLVASRPAGFDSAGGAPRRGVRLRRTVPEGLDNGCCRQDSTRLYFVRATRHARSLVAAEPRRCEQRTASAAGSVASAPAGVAGRHGARRAAEGAPGIESGAG
jgi:hypothetical protein